MNDVASEYIVESLKSLKGLKSTAEKAIEQINDEEMHIQFDPDSNSVAIIIKHIAGNMLSRFTDFLTSDGEKEWRKRDEEFIEDNLTHENLFVQWNRGWQCVFDAVGSLTPEDLLKKVYIRNEEHTVIRALQRQLVHYAYHIGQIVYVCKQIRKKDFKTLSIPKKV
jgi:hypothetical protein